MSQRVLVTGATGFVGVRLLAALSREGHQAMGLARAGSDVDVDLCDRVAVLAAVQRLKPDVVVHLAAMVTGRRDGDLYRNMYRTHVLGTRSLVQALKGSGIRMVAAGSYAELGDAPAPFTPTTLPQPASPYGLTKLFATELLRLRAIEEQAPTLVLRAANLYGPGQRASYFIPAMLRAFHARQRFAMSPGEQRREFLFVDDFVAALLAAAAAPLAPEHCDREGPFCLLYAGEGKARPLKQVAEMAQQVMAVDGLVALGERPYRAREQMAMFADLSLTYRVLGWEPKTELEQGLRSCAAEIVK
jgi:nucleoside-diphosphate-sugar epimerase